MSEQSLQTQLLQVHICTIHAFDVNKNDINYLKSSTARCIAHTGDLQDFNMGTICGQGDYLCMAAMLGLGGPSVAATLGLGGLIMGDY